MGKLCRAIYRPDERIDPKYIRETNCPMRFRDYCAERCARIHIVTPNEFFNLTETLLPRLRLDIKVISPIFVNSVGTTGVTLGKKEKSSSFFRRKVSFSL